MAFLLEHLPPQVHLVISTRADPALPLARLRARGELVEVRAADLRFTLDEVAAYLNDVIGLDLAANDIAALEGRTEGWIAALQLAALSMQGRDDIARLHRRLRRGRPVHRRLPRRRGAAAAARPGPDVPAAHLSARPVERPAVRRRHRRARRQGHAGGAGPREPVRGPARRPPPVVPLPPPLRGRAAGPPARTSGPTRSPTCTAGPAGGTSKTGEPSPAVRHALAAGDVERAAEPGRAGHPGAARNRQEATIRGWLDAIPDEVVRDPAGARGRLHRGADGRQRVRGRRGTTAGRRAVAGPTTR